MTDEQTDDAVIESYANKAHELRVWLRTVVDKRYDRSIFDDDKAFADWAQSMARHFLTVKDPPSTATAEFHEAMRESMNDPTKRLVTFPEVVCLCGSTRFYDAFQEANYRLTMEGRIVLSVGFYPHAQDKAHGEDKHCTPEQKEALDELHKRKIDLADRVLVLNVGGYIGSSTRGEIDYAERAGKLVEYLEPADCETGLSDFPEDRAPCEDD